MRKNLGMLLALSAMMNPNMGDIRGMGEPIRQPMEPTPYTNPFPTQRDLDKLAAAQEKRRKRALKRLNSRSVQGRTGTAIIMDDL